VLDYRTCCFFPSDMTQTPPSWAGGRAMGLARTGNGASCGAVERCSQALPVSFSQNTKGAAREARSCRPPHDPLRWPDTYEPCLHARWDEVPVGFNAYLRIILELRNGICLPKWHPRGWPAGVPLTSPEYRLARDLTFRAESSVYLPCVPLPFR
jgi:hypothetical protein